MNPLPHPHRQILMHSAHAQTVPEKGVSRLGGLVSYPSILSLHSAVSKSGSRAQQPHLWPPPMTWPNEMHMSPSGLKLTIV